MRKENKLTKIAIFALIVAIIATILVSGTYARYTTRLTGTDTVEIAKWAWNISGEDISNTTTTYTLDLFNTIDSSNGSAEQHTASGKIAPGTQGRFDILITNNSEVDATYAVTFSEDNQLGANIEYSIDNSHWGNVSTLDITATAIDQGDSTTLPIYWRWSYNVSNDQNTADTLVGFGANTTPEVTVEATLELIQVD